MPSPPYKVISGGQSGIDLLGLEIARALRISTGGTAPRGYRTEDGTNPELLSVYGLAESPGGDYMMRTLRNILDAELTVVLGDVRSPGSRRTIALAHALGKPLLQNPTAYQLYQKLDELRVRTLNVAGNRASKLTPARRELARTVLTQALQMWVSGCSFMLALN